MLPHEPQSCGCMTIKLTGQLVSIAPSAMGRMAAITAKIIPSSTAFGCRVLGIIKHHNAASFSRRNSTPRSLDLACKPAAFVARETGVIRRVRVRLHRWRTMRSCYHEGREDSQHKNGAIRVTKTGLALVKTSSGKRGRVKVTNLLLTARLKCGHSTVSRQGPTSIKG